MSEKSNPPGDKVGPGRPPRDTRWKKGCKSPNPRGRPRKGRSALPDLKKVFEQALNKKIPVSRGDRQVMMTRGEIGFEQLLNQVAKGDRHALRLLMEVADRLGIDFLAAHKQTVEEAALAPSYQTILDAFVARRTGTGNVAPTAPVLAPPELLDDDAEEPEAQATGASPPTTVTEPEIPEPTPEPGKTYPKAFSRMTRLEKQAWHPEWWAKYGEAYEKRQKAKEQQAALKRDLASIGRGNPPPGGVSLTTGKWT